MSDNIIITGIICFAIIIITYVICYYKYMMQKDKAKQYKEIGIYIDDLERISKRLSSLIEEVRDIRDEYDSLVDKCNEKIEEYNKTIEEYNKSLDDENN